MDAGLQNIVCRGIADELKYILIVDTKYKNTI